MQQHIQKCALLKECCGEVLQILDQPIVGLRPVHGKVEAVFVALGRVREIASVGAIRDHEELGEFVERSLAVEALFAVAVNLIERFADCHTALLQLDLHKWQSIDEDRHVIAVEMITCLLELLDDLQLVTCHIALVEQVDVLDTAFVEDEIVDVIVMNLAGLVDDPVARTIEIGGNETRPFGI